MTWRVGDRVENITEYSWVYAGTEKFDKMNRPRKGFVREVPLAAETTGSGTLLIEWESLNGVKGDLGHWQMWVHSDHVRRLAE